MMNMKHNGLPTLSAMVLALSSAMAFAQTEAQPNSVPNAQPNAEAEQASKPVQRVPYISEAVKAQIRNEIKE